MSQTTDVSRRQLLRGRFDRKQCIRPPWSGDDAVFTEQCTRCGDCISACETGLLIKGSGGFPEADFKYAECTFCEACVNACEPKALVKTVDTPPWHIQASIQNNCLAQNKVHCRTCGEHCESEAISFLLAPGGIALPTLNTELCNGCGACVASCPVSAVRMQPAQENNS